MPGDLLRDVGTRPVMSRERMTGLTEQILAMTSVDTATIMITHTARVITRFANDRILTGDDGDEVELYIIAQSGHRTRAVLMSNQLEESTLRSLVRQCEMLARVQLVTKSEFRHERPVQDTYVPVAVWRDATVKAMTTPEAAIVPTLIERIVAHGFHAAGFVGLMARAQVVMSKEGIFAFGEETDCEVTATARTADGTASGWAGQAARDWSAIDAARIADDASVIARLSVGAQGVEPGRRTAILGPAAVAQLLRHLTRELDAFDTDNGRTAFSRSPRGGNKIGQQVFDRRIRMSSDPADRDAGYLSFFGQGYATTKMTWIDDGILKNLSYNPFYAMSRGKSYTAPPDAFRIEGGTQSIDAMIASCPEGIYVNRLSSVDLLDQRTGMTTGVTRDGCFLIKNGKIDRAVKNFRILDSPFFFLNKILALGATGRVAFGYTPPGKGEGMTTWPRPPVVVPAMMVEDFHFSGLSDVA
jgi:predicted Zn-dependent protease